ncbi:MAG: DUF1015 domain-containing protein [Clostridia bacterium]|nr:DUF1015 domain-containing protein [Clostridia bacterium]
MSIFKAADILLPKNVDFAKWSVVACDQYSSEPEYWKKAAELAEGSPSTLNIIYPEAYLSEADGDKRIEKINRTMEQYLDDGIFNEYKDSLIYVERTQQNGKTRCGIVGCIDLEAYDYSVGSQSPVRATEGTIISRIPPRQRIRRNAPLELPHILMLADDREREIIETLAGIKDKLEIVYDFELMQGGGHIKGWLLDSATKADVLAKVGKLECPDAFEKKYGVKDKGVLAIAVGDGNHSLATAKACWEEIKKTLTPEGQKNHPARFALAELENLHDDALEFEPIHRVVFDVDPETVIKAMYEYYPQMTETDNGGQKIVITYQGTEKAVYITDAPANLAVGTFQQFMDKYLSENKGEIDYIHGADVVRNLTKPENTIGFIFDAMEKNDLFTTVIKDGALPRKTFSMGESYDKRFYLECKKIK